MATQTKEQPQTTAVTKTDSEKFTGMVMREFSGTVGGGMEMTQYQRKLAQHLFIKIDATLKDMETKRLTKQNAASTKPMIWANVNLNKLAIDAVHRVDLGLDALIPNHIHPIPYFSSREGKYDLDLRIGYVGKDYYRRKVAPEEPIRIIYELVHASDTFRPIKKSLKNDAESYEFEITSPFDRGAVVGGFGYIMYEDSRKNQLVLVTPKNFARSKGAAKSVDFWAADEEAMQFKTIVHRVTDKLGIDPEKVNESFITVEADEQAAEAGIIEEIETHANSEPLVIEGRVVDRKTGEVTQEQQAETEPSGNGKRRVDPGF